MKSQTIDKNNTGVGRELTAESCDQLVGDVGNILQRNMVASTERNFRVVLNLVICKMACELSNDGELRSLAWGYLPGLLSEGAMLIGSKVRGGDDSFTFSEGNKDYTRYVVDELIGVLQQWKLIGEHPHQVLSDMYELFTDRDLRYGFGQFFTPLPITRFIVRSLPFKEAVESGKEISILDNACGSGHFLMEATHEVRMYTEPPDSFDISSQVVGIELRDILCDVARLNCLFLYKKIPTIVNGSGIAKMDDPVYEKNVKLTMHEQFNFIVANPPYSIRGFKKEMDSVENGFTLYDKITDVGVMIEIIFIERMIQMLKVGGVAGIVLPRGVLHNLHSYDYMRRLLLHHCEVKAVVELSVNTFLDTTVNSVILFFKKIDTTNSTAIKKDVKQFFNDFKDKKVGHGGTTFSYYLQNVHGESIEQFKQGLSSKKIRVESHKMWVYFLTYNKKVILVNAPVDNKLKEIEFLGYQFITSPNNNRMGLGHVGEGKLFNSANRLDDKFINSYILKHFLNEEIGAIHEDVRPYMQVADTQSCFQFKGDLFDTVIESRFRKYSNFDNRYPLVATKNFFYFHPDTRRDATIGQKGVKGKYPYFRASRTLYTANIRDYQEECIIMGWGGKIPCIFLSKNFGASGSVRAFKSTDPLILNAYVYFYLKCNTHLIADGFMGSIGLQHISFRYINELQVPIPPLGIQRDIIEKLTLREAAGEDLYNNLFFNNYVEENCNGK